MMQLQVGSSYDADPDRVEAVLLDEARKAAGAVTGLLASPAPQVRFAPGFGESSMDFTVVCAVEDTPSIPAVQGELRKRIVRRFRQEGIGIPYPHRVVLMREEKR